MTQTLPDPREPVPAAAEAAAAGASPRTFRLEDALDRFNSDHELVVELAMMLSATVPEHAKALETAAKAADWPAVARHAHTLYGAASNLSAAEVCALSHVIEGAARTGGDAITADLLAALSGATSDFAREARAWAEARSPGSEEAPCAS
jgi:HPt (histidine-containing phosphotransfer) domain-containing protein